MLEKIGRNIGKIFLGIVAILLFLFGYQCGHSDENPVIRESKTIYRDTIFPKDTIIAFKDRPVPYPVYIDTNKYKLLPVDSLEIGRFFEYKDSIENQDIILYSTIHTQGKTLKDFKPSYKLKVPLIIKDSVIIKQDSLIFDKYEIHGGIIASPSILAPTIDLSINRGTYGVGYDPFKKQIIVTAKYRFYSWTPKKKK